MEFYLPLPRKYRPKTFSQVVGQRAAVRTVKNAVKSGRVANAYLFTGPRGVGKTTLARLLAKALNCQNPKDGEPCNECENCKAVTSGSFPDLIELDAASNRGIDDVRQLQEGVAYAPIKGKTKVYIIDEVHMLTKEAFNALLKTLEEPPPRTVFVLCTTEADKVPATVRSRCQRIVFRRLSEEELLAHLREVCKKEGLDCEEEALQLIVSLSEGCARDALALLDQAATYGEGRVSAAAVREMVGLAPREALVRFVAHLLKGDAAGCLAQIERLEQEGADLFAFLREVHRSLFEALLHKQTGAPAGEFEKKLAKLPFERLLYAERLADRALGELRFKEPSVVLRALALKAPLIKELISLSELASRLSGGEVRTSSEGEQKEEKPKRKFSSAGELLSAAVKEGVLSAAAAAALKGFIRTQKGEPVLEVDAKTYGQYAAEIEKLKGFAPELRVIKKEVGSSEKKFKLLREDTPHLF